MMFPMRVLLTIITTLTSLPLSTFGHILLTQPPHIGQISNSPLEGPNAQGGGSYPCKYNGSPSFYANPVRTTIPLGSNYTVKFTGSAVHGGGSCQFSLSKDLAPTASSEFKVIYSVQGGCPARNTPGNLGGGADMADPFEYPFTMPPDLEPGQYTFAWSWINKVGNREFYMNCAAVDVTATAEHQGDPSYYATLPDMTVANVKGVDCVSEADNGMGAFQYQNPGQFVETNDALQKVAKQCFAPIVAASAPNPQSSNQSADPIIANGTSNISSTMTTTTARQQTTVPGIFASKTTKATTPSGFATISTGTVISSSSVAPPSFPIPGNKTSPCPSTWQTCTTTGFFCVDETHFGICSNGCMPQTQPLSEGVKCDLATNTLYDSRIKNSSPLG